MPIHTISQYLTVFHGAVKKILPVLFAAIFSIIIRNDNIDKTGS